MNFNDFNAFNKFSQKSKETQQYFNAIQYFFLKNCRKNLFLIVRNFTEKKIYIFSFISDVY